LGCDRHALRLEQWCRFSRDQFERLREVEDGGRQQLASTVVNIKVSRFKDATTDVLDLLTKPPTTRAGRRSTSRVTI